MDCLIKFGHNYMILYDSLCDSLRAMSWLMPFSPSDCLNCLIFECKR